MPHMAIFIGPVGVVRKVIESSQKDISINDRKQDHLSLVILRYGFFETFLELSRVVRQGVLDRFALKG